MQLLLPLAAGLASEHAVASLRGGARGGTCEDKAHSILFLDDHPEPRATHVSRAPERALDYCGLKPEATRKYFCTYFEDFVRDAFAYEPQKADVTPGSFCKLTEAHGGEVEAQVKMFGMIAHYWGLNETEADAPFHGTCVADVHKAIAPEEAASKERAADDLYLFCMNYQDCDHHTMAGAGKGCEISHHNPATGKHLCELLRSDVVKFTVTRPQDSYTPDELCNWLLGFTHRQARQHEAYRYVMHGEERTPSLIPTVGPAMDALLLSRLANGAKAHWVRDHQAHFVVRSAAAWLAVLGLAAA